MTSRVKRSSVPYISSTKRRDFKGLKLQNVLLFTHIFFSKRFLHDKTVTKEKKLGYDRSIFSLNSYTLYRNDDRMFKTQVQRGFTSFIRSITV